MSLFVPLVACWLAFYFLGDQDELHIWRIGVAGISCGGMSESDTWRLNQMGIAKDLS